MRHIPIRLGPLALLLTVISICLTTLAILVFTTARADHRLAEKYAETVYTRYALEAEGQDYLSRMDAHPLLLPGVDGEGVSWHTLERDGMRLRIGLEPAEDGYRIISWRIEREWTEDTDIGRLWSGNQEGD